MLFAEEKLASEAGKQKGFESLQARGNYVPFLVISKRVWDRVDELLSIMNVFSTSASRRRSELQRKIVSTDVEVSRSQAGTSSNTAPPGLSRPLRFI